MTQDGYPIDLGRISIVMQCSEKQAETLLQNLIDENENTGTYDQKIQVFTKGININFELKKLEEKNETLEKGEFH